MQRLIHPTPFIIHPPENLFREQHDLRRRHHALGIKYASNQVVTEADLRIIGNQLWNLLNLDDTFDLACKSAGTAILPIIIESNAGDVQVLPWETLYHPKHGFLGKHAGFTLTRRMGRPQDSTLQLEKGPLRILLFTSLPEDVNPETGRLNVEEEQAQVQEALLPWIAKGLVQLEMPDDGRFSTLKELLKSFQPHVLFLSGHGRFYHAPHADESYGMFFFEDEVGNSEAIKEDEIANVLISLDKLQVVVLSACESGKAASHELSHGLMRSIRAQGIPHVIGMRESILDRAGIQFARALCNALAQGERIDFALQAARMAIQTPMKDVSADERSLGQWCLPMLVSFNLHTPLIDWDFQPKEFDSARHFKPTLDDVGLPARFVGRRAEMRQVKSRLLKGEFHKLLITGLGGQGKTSLAGKLALDMQKRGWQVFAWSTKLNKSWHDFELEMEQTLEKLRVDRYNRFLSRTENELERAKMMLNLLMERFNGRVIFFLDSLDSVQDPDMQVLNDERIHAWIDAARETQDLILLATSRWQIPDWDGEHLMLTHANYGDFLQMAQGFYLPLSVLERREELRRVYEVLGGNSRGLGFFAVAVRDIQNAGKEPAFLDVLAQTKANLQTDIAIEEIYEHLPPAAQMLFRRLPAYHEPVPLEGLIKLGLDLPQPEALLERLLAVSLLEASYKQYRNVTQYQCDPVATAWLDEQKLIDTNLAWLNAAAGYHLYLLTQKHQSLDRALANYHALRRAERHPEADRLMLNLRTQERQLLNQAFAAYYALRRAERHPEADRLTLDYIVGPLAMDGFYQRLLTELLPRICNSEELQTRGRALAHTGMLLKNIGDYEQALSKHKQALDVMRQINNKQGEGATLSNIAQIYHMQGDYETALAYLRQALTLRQQISDRAGEGTTLNNMATAYQARGDYETALEYLKQALAIQQQINDKQGEGATLSNIAQIYHVKGDHELVRKYLKQALAIQQQIGDKAGEGTTLNNISQMFKAQGEYEIALEYLKQALAIQQQIGDKAGEGTTLNNISGIYHRQGDYEKALEKLEQALAIQQQIGDQAKEGVTLNNISGIYKRQNDYETALAYLKKALAIQQQIGDRAGEGTTLNNMATAHQARGDHVTALEYLEQALAIRKKIGDKAGEVQSLNNIAIAFQARGDDRTALEHLEQALAIGQQINYTAGQGLTFNNIAMVYQARGDDKMALEYLKKALAIQQQIGDQANEGTTSNNIAEIYHRQGDYKTALEYLEQAVAIRDQIGDKAGEALSLNNISQIYKAQEEYKTALEYLEHALAIQQKIGDKAGLCTTFLNMVHIHVQNKQMQEAVRACVTVYPIAKRMNMVQVLQELANLAPTVGLPENLDGWEMLAQKMKE